MPTYEFRCATCETVFEDRRSMAAADDPATCPDGHVGAKRLLSVFAAISGGGDTLRAAPSNSTPSHSGGCCGGGCH